METYNRLIRIKYDNKLFDIFEDGKHNKFFLEVRKINNIEKYFYLNMKDYIFLNKIYNCKNLNNLSENDKKNNKLKFFYKVYVTTSIGFITFSMLGGLKLLPNVVLEKTAFTFRNISDSTRSLDVISDVSELDKYYTDTFTFDDLRRTLDNNKNINEHYKGYCNKFIDALEKNLPNLDLTLFNDHLKNLKIIDVLDKEWPKYHSNAVGLYNKSDNIIRIREGSENDMYVIFHELVHSFRLGHLETNNIHLNIDYRVDDYGDTFNEAFTELVTDYLIADIGESYFEDINQLFLHYSEYATSLFQILKLTENEYTIYDFFNHDVEKLRIVLEKYGLEDLIILYDIDKDSNLIRDIVVADKTRIMDLESKLLSLRIRQEIEKGTELSEVYRLTGVFNNQDSKHVFEEITNCIKENDNWIYCYTNVNDVYEHERDYGNGPQTIKYSNPNIKIFNGDNIVYDGTLSTVNEIFIDNLYVVMEINNNDIKYKLVLLEGDKYIDVVSKEEVKSNFTILGLKKFIGNDYNCEINLNPFLNSDFVNSKMISENEIYNQAVNLDAFMKDDIVLQESEINTFNKRR